MKGKVRCHSLAHYDISNRNVIVVSSVVYRSFEIVHNQIIDLLNTLKYLTIVMRNDCTNQEISFI